MQPEQMFNVLAQLIVKSHLGTLTMMENIFYNQLMRTLKLYCEAMEISYQEALDKIRGQENEPSGDRKT